MPGTADHESLRRRDTQQTVLINWLYAWSVGHTLEGFKHGRGLLEVNPQLDVHILVPRNPAATLAPAGLTAHPVDLNRPARDLRRLPAEWDYLITDPRILNTSPGDPAWCPAWAASRSRFRAMVRSGSAPTFEEGMGTREAAILAYRQNAPLALAAPPIEANWSPDPSGINVCVLPAGQSSLRSPSLDAWRAICRAVESRHNGAVTFTSPDVRPKLSRCAIASSAACRAAVRQPANWSAGASPRL